MNVYWASIEFEYPKNAKLDGGFVYAFVEARDARDALTRIDAAIQGKSFREKAVEFVALYEDVPWESSDEAERYAKLSDLAATSGDVVFDDIFAYEESE